MNPNYPAPPCSPQDIVDVQNQILQVLDSRAKAEATAAAMTRQEAHHKANEKPLDNMEKGTDEAISATDAHKQAVARRTEANEKKKEKETDTGGKLSDYSNRAAQLTTITVPMKGFERFTSLAYSLPDDWPELVGAKRGILKMNADSKKFLSQLEKMDSTIAGQKAGQPAREAGIQADKSTLTQTDKKADESDKGLKDAKQTTGDLKTDNKDKLKEATTVRTEASSAASSLDSQAQQKQAHVESLAASLQAWAQEHQKARNDALEATKKKLEQRGYKVTEVHAL